MNLKPRPESSQLKERCYACGKAMRSRPNNVWTIDGQPQPVGRDCFKKVQSALGMGWQPPRGGPRLFLHPPTEDMKQGGVS